MLTRASDETAARYVVSVAFDARTSHVDPASPGVKVVFNTVQVPDVTVHDTVPVPLPPLVVSVSD
jgi:hypothetical protein